MYARYRLLFENPALVRRGWLPSADDVPELADLREEHTRLLDARAQASADASALAQQREAEEEARRAAQESEFLGQAKVELPPITTTDDELVDARVRAQAAQDALQTFVRSAI